MQHVKRSALSWAEQRALRALPFKVHMWAGEPVDGWPKTVTSRAMALLQRDGLLDFTEHFDHVFCCDERSYYAAPLGTKALRALDWNLPR
jgi:hypothetical protein